MKWSNIRPLAGCILAPYAGTLAEEYGIEFLTDIHTGLLNPNANARVLTLARLGNMAHSEGQAARLKELRR